MPRGGRFVHHRFVAAPFSGYIMFTRGSVVRRCAFFAPTADLLRCLTPIRLVHDRLLTGTQDEHDGGIDGEDVRL
jgi:hypothetical protein